ncbi:MAG: CHAT domain-containing protein [Acidobacteriota bacterium]
MQFDLALLARALDWLHHGWRRNAPPGTVGVHLHDPTLEIGRHLFSILRGDRADLQDFLATPPARRLRLCVDAGRPALRWLLTLPWELLFDDTTCSFRGLDGSLSLVRSFASSDAGPPSHHALATGLRPTDEPLRLLLAIASPSGQPTLDPSPTLAALRDHALGRSLQVDVLHHATASSLRSMVRQRQPQALHLMAHAGHDSFGAASALVLESGQGSPEAADAARLESLWPRSLRLVTVDSQSHDADPDPSAALGAALALSDRPLVVALQHRMAAPATTAFVRSFYGALADREPVEIALQAARRSVASAHSAGVTDWAAPALYARA